MRCRYGVEAMADYIQQVAVANYGKPMPCGFHRDYCEEAFEVKFSFARLEAFRRSLQFYVKRKAVGAVTRVALRGNRKVGSFRGDGGRNNSKKSLEMIFLLLQYFVVVVQNMYTRADSCLMLRHARRLHLVLLQDGCDEGWLPDAGAQWYRRCRRECGIVYKTCGKLKAHWSSIVRRFRVLLVNIFRVRCFWGILFSPQEDGFYLVGPEALLVQQRRTQGHLVQEKRPTARCERKFLPGTGEVPHFHCGADF